jgi:hypothetical protein
MEVARAVDREGFDHSARLLMASLRESKTLNWEIRKALQDKERTGSVSKVDLATSTIIGDASA